MDAATRRLVRKRAADSCEYCHLRQSAAPFLTFHIEHIVAQQHANDDSPDNLALACPDCNRRKGPNLTTFCLECGQIIRLFNPRADIWEEHFSMEGILLVGRTRIGEATIRLLQLNSNERLQVRAEITSSDS